MRTLGGDREVRPCLSLVEDRLAAYGPDDAAEITGIAAGTIRGIARKVAAKRTNIIGSLGNGKYYHGDLVELA